MALAEIGAPIGLKGAVRLRTFDSAATSFSDHSALFDVKACWVKTANGRWIHSDILECSPQTRGLKLQLALVDDRTKAEALRGAQVGLGRSAFPQLDEEENYWADLLGCQVVNRQGLVLGNVQSMQANSEHDWLVLAQGWIPFVSRYIDQVDPDKKLILVDWEPDWFD